MMCSNCVNGNHTGTNGTPGCKGECPCKCNDHEHSDTGPKGCMICDGCRKISRELTKMILF